MPSFPRTVMLLGSGELGKEVAIAAQRLGCRVIACDRYAGAPAMQVADVAEVLPMTDADALLEVVRRHQPDVVIPEIEALAVHALAELEQEGITVIPTARATAVTMNRDRIRTWRPANSVSAPPASPMPPVLKNSQQWRNHWAGPSW